MVIGNKRKRNVISLTVTKITEQTTKNSKVKQSNHNNVSLKQYSNLP